MNGSNFHSVNNPSAIAAMQQRIAGQIDFDLPRAGSNPDQTAGQNHRVKILAGEPEKTTIADDSAQHGADEKKDRVFHLSRALLVHAVVVPAIH